MGAGAIVRSVKYVSNVAQGGGAGSTYTVPGGCYLVIGSVFGSPVVNMPNGNQGTLLPGGYLGEGTGISIPGGANGFCGALFSNS